MTVLLGLDLSVTAAAAVAVPTDWDGAWPRVCSLVVGEKLRRDATDAERARRCETIATRLVAFARETGASVAWIESPAYSQNTAAHVLGALRGVVTLELVRAGIDVRTAPMASARKLLLGKLPRADVKVAVHTALRTAGAPRDWTLDVSDAMCAANWGLSETAGAFCFVQSGERAA